MCGHLLISAQYLLREFMAPGQLEKCCVFLESKAPCVATKPFPTCREVGPVNPSGSNLPDQSLFWIKIAATPLVDLSELGSSEA